MVNTLPSIVLMGFTFGIHIMLVNIDIGMSIIIPFLKRYGEVHQRPHYVREARRYMQYVAVIYAIAGVFGTAFTVFILTFFPDFLWLAGMALYIPFTLAGVFVSIRLFAISAYWYTWDRLKPNHHFLIGLVLASTSFTVPFAFRAIFGFLNNGKAIDNVDPLEINPWAFFTNITFWPLYLKSVFGALTFTFFALTSVYVFRMKKEQDPGILECHELLLKNYFRFGVWTLLPQILFGIWYSIALYYDTSYKFNNIMGLYVGKSSEGTNLNWLFDIKMILVLYQIIIASYIYFNKEIQLTDPTPQWLLLSLGPIAGLSVLLGELLNEIAQLPYFVAQPDLKSALPMINIEEAINPLADAFGLYAITVFGIIPLLLAASVLVYYILTIRESEIVTLHE